MEEQITEKFEREKKVLNFFKRKFNWFVYLILVVILWINIKIRIIPMKINPLTGNPGLWDITTNNWTLGPDLDPFFFLRWAKTIIEQGSLPVIDTMRYVPLGYETTNSTTLLPNLIVYLYRFLHLFYDKVTVEYAAVILPVIFSVFTAIAFFLLVKKIFEEKGKKISSIIALIATFFLVTLPSLLPRTIAGIPEKESVAFGLMFFTFYFVLCAWKSNKIWKGILFGIIAGFFTGMMALIWGGVLFIYVTMAIAGFIAFMFYKIHKKEFIVYSSWIVSSVLFWLPFTARYSLVEILTSASTGIAFMVWVFMGVYLVLDKYNLLNFKKIPRTIISIIVSILVLVLLSSIFISPQVIPNIAKNMIRDISNPYSDRLSYTVAENKQPFFSDWKSSFGPLIKGIPLFFWLFFIGSIFLFYEMIKHLKKQKVLLTISYILFLLALVFSNYSSTSILNGSSGLSLFVYFTGFLILICGFGYVLFFKKEGNLLKESKFEYLFLFSLFIVGIIAGRSGIRLIMLLAPIAVIPISYLTITVINGLFEKKKDLVKLFFIIFSIFIIISVPYTLYYNYQVSRATAEAHIPNQYTYQWQEAMSWVRENTTENAVFGNWWDYGYWIQTMGERATMLDGGNSISYWDYLMGRHGLTASNESEALELFYNHNITYFLIDSTDIGKYPAFSSIGSDENYDRFSWIGIFLMDESKTIEEKNVTTYIYFGGVSLDEDIIIDKEGKEVLFPREVAGAGALIIPIDKNGEFLQPSVIIVYGEKQYEIKLRYLFYNGELKDFGSGIEGATYLFPSLVGSEQGVNVNPVGASMFLSPKNMRALWVRMYLLEEGENFHLVHNEPDQIVKELRNQGLNISEIIYFGGIRGPIKIWEVEYTGEEKYNEEYLQRTYPESIIGRRFQ